MAPTTSTPIDLLPSLALFPLLLANTCGRLTFDLPSPLQGVPWLVFPLEGTNSSQKQKFHSIVDGKIEERHNHHFRHSSCLTNANGWMLLQNDTSLKVFLFNPYSSQRCRLPRLIDEDPYMFVLVSTPGKPDCFIVAVYIRECRPYFLYASPKGQKWEKYDLKVVEDFKIRSAANCNGKVYLYGSKGVLVAIHFTPLPIVEYFETKLPVPTIVGGAHEWVTDLVASRGDLFLIDSISYSNTKRTIFRTVTAVKLDFSSMTWERVETLNDLVFAITATMAYSFPAASTKLKANCIYIVDGNALSCFDVEYGSLTTSYPCSDAIYKPCLPFWLLPDDTQMNQLPNKKEAINIACSYEKFLFDHPKFLSSHASNKYSIVHRSKLSSRWCPVTPWLMFTHKDNGTYKVLDPYTKTEYELHVPDLSGCLMLAAKGGWLFVKGKPSPYFYFVNPFTKERRKASQLPDHYPFGAAFSSPPTSSDCMVFCISRDESSLRTVKICVNCPSNEKWTTLEFENNVPFRLAHSNIVYLNSCFYCLGMNGNLGVYDPTKHTWHVLRMPVHLRRVYNCSLAESRGTLLSVFIDLFQRPIGVFVFDMKLLYWKRITSERNETFFFGDGASFSVTPATESMRNMIYFPTFQRECSLDLITYPLSNAKVGYVHVWIEPKSVLCGLDSVTGKVIIST